MEQTRGTGVLKGFYSSMNDLQNSIVLLLFHQQNPDFSKPAPYIQGIEDDLTKAKKCFWSIEAKEVPDKAPFDAFCLAISANDLVNKVTSDNRTSLNGALTDYSKMLSNFWESYIRPVEESTTEYH